MSEVRTPSFIIAGAAKSATTWLQKSLQGSGRIFMPAHEPHFFSREYERGLPFYRAAFADAAPGALVGEKSNSYLTTPHAASRLHRHLPHVRLVFQLRNPTQRAYSDYLMLFRRGEVDGDIARHLDPERASSNRFLHDGKYAEHLQRFLDLFGSDQILVLLYEDMSREPGAHLRRLADHIGLADELVPPLEQRVKDAKAAAVPRQLRRALAPLRPILDPVRDTAVMQGLRKIVARPHVYPVLDQALRTQIDDFYRPQIARLQAMTRISLEAWTCR